MKVPPSVQVARSAVGLALLAMFAMAAGLASPSRATRPSCDNAASHGALLPDVPPLPEVEATDEPGLLLTIEPGNAAGQPPFADKRVARMLAMQTAAGSAASPFAAKGAYKAIFEGDMNMRLRDFLIFSAIGHGKLKLTINDKPVLDLAGEFSGKVSESIRLGKGKNHVIATYEPEANGEGELRLLWGTKSTSAEPIPPMVFTHAGGDKPLRQSLRLREGRLLIAQFRCTKCHAVSDIVKPDNAGAMPELAMDAPSFENIGGRLNADWMAAWISNPRAFRPASHMPRLFHSGDGTAPEARAIAAYLATLGSTNGQPEKADPAKAQAGGRLFANLNCVACHISPERAGGPPDATDAGRISLAYVQAKFKPTALKQFLLNPSAHYAWIAMPNFRLTEQEADELAAYLLSMKGQAVPAAGLGDAGLAAKGAALVKTAGCLNCHTLGKQAPAQPTLSIAFGAITKDGWSRGCMAADEASGKSAPRFSLTDAQRGAILAFAATDRSSLARDCSPEFAERQIVTMRCTACHARDGRESLLATDLDAELQALRGKYPNPQQTNGEATAPDQRAPMITWAGEKLRPQWMQKFIAGEIPYKPRYYLRARMPGFAVRARGIAEGLVQEHGCLPNYPEYGPPDAKLAGIGQTLVGKTPNMSFGCVQCHAINQQPALAPFEAPAINFMYVTSRLREDYYYRWIHDPLKVDPETKMPRFDDADGKTGVPIFDSNARKQFEAIWNYLLLGKQIAPPAQ